jgi:hypothetical protein
VFFVNFDLFLFHSYLQTLLCFVKSERLHKRSKIRMTLQRPEAVFLVMCDPPMNEL